MYALYDDYKRSIISRHRTLETSAKAKEKFVDRLLRNNSSGSSLPIILVRVDSSGKVSPISDDDHYDFGMLLDNV